MQETVPCSASGNGHPPLSLLHPRERATPCNNTYSRNAINGEISFHVNCTFLAIESIIYLIPQSVKIGILVIIFCSFENFLRISFFLISESPSLCCS